MSVLGKTRKLLKNFCSILFLLSSILPDLLCEITAMILGMAAPAAAGYTFSAFITACAWLAMRHQLLLMPWTFLDPVDG